MNSITATYPGFQALPKGVKRLLVVSESLFFEDATAFDQGHAGQPGQKEERRIPARYARNGDPVVVWGDLRDRRP